MDLALAEHDAWYWLRPILGLLVMVVLPSYLGFRWHLKKKRARQAREAALHAVPEELGGSMVADLKYGRPRSAQRRKPLGELYRPKTISEGMTFPSSPPTVEFAADLPRRDRQFRVSAYWCSLRVGANSSRRIYEYTIETKVGPTPSMKIAKAYPTEPVRMFGRTMAYLNYQQRLFEAEARTSPSAARWEQFTAAENEFTGYASDQDLSAQVIAPETMDWLRGNHELLPDLIGLEHGWCYAVYRDEIDPATLVARIDLIADFLDRINVPAAV